MTLTWGLAPLAMPVTLEAPVPVGAAGTVAAVTGALADDAAPVPAGLVAVTVTV